MLKYFKEDGTFITEFIYFKPYGMGFIGLVALRTPTTYVPQMQRLISEGYIPIYEDTSTKNMVVDRLTDADILQLLGT